MSEIKEEKPHVAFEYETMSVGSRSLLVQSTKRANEQSVLRQRVKRGMSKLWELGRFRADSERAECAERSIILLQCGLESRSI